MMGRWWYQLALSIILLQRHGWAFQWTSGASQSVVLGASSVAVSDDGSVAYAAAGDVSSAGSIYKSTDYGATWTSLSASCASASEVACSSTGQYVVATVYEGLVYVSADSGATWTAADPGASGSPGYYGYAAVSYNGSVMAVTSYGNIFVSRDAGVSWSAGDSPQSPWTGLSISKTGKFMVATDDSYIYMTHNFGAHWVRLSSLGSAVWQDVAMSRDGSIITVAEYGGKIWRSEDFGLTMSKTAAPSGNWTGVACSSDGETLLAANDYMHLYSSTDGGASWRVESAAGKTHWGNLALSSGGSFGLVSDRTGDRVLASSSITAAPTPAPTTALSTLSGGKGGAAKAGKNTGATAGAAISAVIGVGVVSFAGYLVMKVRASSPVSVSG